MEVKLVTTDGGYEIRMASWNGEWLWVDGQLKLPQYDWEGEYHYWKVKLVPHYTGEHKHEHG